MTARTGRAVVAGYRVGWGLVRRMPARVAYAVFDRIADLAWHRGGRSVQRLRANYARVRPELDDRALEELVRAGMRSYLRYWCEVFRLPELTSADLAAAVRTVGTEPVVAHLAGDRPVVMFLGHLGNWDLAGAWGTTALAPVTTVAERLEPEELFEQFLAFRESLGMRILPLTEGSDVFRELRSALTGPAFVPLLADRDLTAGGVEVDFCGHRARMAVGPAALAVSTGAALHPVTIHYERGAGARHSATNGWQIAITWHDEVVAPGTGTTRDKVRAMTQQCADALAGTVRSHTEDWHMMQRVFVEDLK